MLKTESDCTYYLTTNNKDLLFTNMRFEEQEKPNTCRCQSSRRIYRMLFHMRPGTARNRTSSPQPASCSLSQSSQRSRHTPLTLRTCYKEYTALSIHAQQSSGALTKTNSSLIKGCKSTSCSSCRCVVASESAVSNTIINTQICHYTS